MNQRILWSSETRIAGYQDTKITVWLVGRICACDMHDSPWEKEKNYFNAGVWHLTPMEPRPHSSFFFRVHPDRPFVNFDASKSVARHLRTT